MKNKKKLIIILAIIFLILICAAGIYYYIQNKSVKTDPDFKKVGDHYEFELYFDGPSTGENLPPNNDRDE